VAEPCHSSRLTVCTVRVPRRWQVACNDRKTVFDPQRGAVAHAGCIGLQAMLSCSELPKETRVLGVPETEDRSRVPVTWPAASRADRPTALRLSCPLM